MQADFEAMQHRPGFDDPQGRIQSEPVMPQGVDDSVVGFACLLAIAHAHHGQVRTLSWPIDEVRNWRSAGVSPRASFARQRKRAKLAREAHLTEFSLSDIEKTQLKIPIRAGVLSQESARPASGFD